VAPTFGRAYFELGNCLSALATSADAPKAVASRRAAEAEAAFRAALAVSLPSA